MNLKRFLFEGETLRLMSITILSKPLGLFSQMLIAAYFGAGHAYDAYSLSFFLVTFVTMTVGRVFGTVAVPQIIKRRGVNGADGTGEFQNAVMMLFLVPMILVLLVLAFFGDVVVGFVGQDLPEETRALAIRMIKLMAWPGLLMALVQVIRPLLNLNKFFRLPAFLPVINVVSMVFSLIVFHKWLGIWALPLGFGLSFAIQLPVLASRALGTGSLVLCRPQLSRPNLKLLTNLAWMVLLAESLLMVNSFADRWFATTLEVGSISSIAYSMTLVNFGVQVFSMSLIVVMFTRMSEFFAANDIVACDGYIRKNLVKVVNLVVPASLILMAASHETVTVLFKRGAFDDVATLRTANTLAMYLLGLPAIVVNGMVARVFHSFQKLRDKIWLGFQYLLTNVLGNLILVKTYGTVGLAISSSVAINLHLLLSLLVLHSYRSGLQTGTYSAIIIRSYLMGLASYLVATHSGLLQWADKAFLIGPSPIDSLLVAAGKAGVILVLYGVQVLLSWKFIRQDGRRL